MWEKIKQHPWIVGAIVGVVLLVLLFSGSSSSVATSSDAAAGTSSGTGDQLQAYLAQLNLQGQAITAQSTAQHEQTAAAVTVAQINASSQDKANELAAQVAEYTSKLQADVLTNRDTLTAQTSQAQIAAGVQSQQIVATALTQQAQINADTNRQWISSLPGIISAQNAPALAAANKKCESYLFGLFSSC